MKASRLKLALAAVALALLLSSCNLLDGLTNRDALSPTQRVNSFILAVSGEQDIAEIKSQFHPVSETYQTIDEAWWDLTVFDDFYQPFTFGPLGEETVVSSGVVITTTFTSADYTSAPAPTTFVLAEDTFVEDNWLILSVDVAGETIRNVR